MSDNDGEDEDSGSEYSFDEGKGGEVQFEEGEGRVLRHLSKVTEEGSVMSGDEAGGSWLPPLPTLESQRPSSVSPKSDISDITWATSNRGSLVRLSMSKFFSGFASYGAINGEDHRQSGGDRGGDGDEEDIR